MSLLSHPLMTKTWRPDGAGGEDKQSWMTRGHEQLVN